jgi:serine/threonine protein kinase
MVWLGKYRLIATLGRGGMADVHLAMINGPGGFSKLAVVKRLRIAFADDPEFVTMLVDEARISANLRHPNVVQTLEVRVDDGKPSLAMEYLDGLSLRHLHRRAATQSISVSREAQYVVVLDVLAGLHHAHELTNFDGTHLAIVHRDVTPHNVFITVDGQVKVLDFGIAKAIGSASITQHGMVKGKLRYMAPEQARGETVDRRADIFSVGIILWEAATGRRFWDHHPETESIGRVLTTGRYRRSPREIDPTLPEALDAICMKALAPNPADRYATTAEFRTDLENFLGDDVIQARRQLAPLVTTLSEEARARLRTVIEAAAMDSEPPPASTRDTDSAVKAVSVSVPDEDDELAADVTKLMPNAPPIPGAPVSASTVQRDKIKQTAGPEVTPATGREYAAVAARRRPPELFIAFGVSAAIVLLGAGVSIHLGSDNSALASRNRTEPTRLRLPLEVSSASSKHLPTVSSEGSETTPSSSSSSPSTSTSFASKSVVKNVPATPKGSKRLPAKAPVVAPSKTAESELTLDTNDPWSPSKGGASR